MVKCACLPSPKTIRVAIRPLSTEDFADFGPSKVRADFGTSSLPQHGDRMTNSHPDVIPFPQRASAPVAEPTPNVLIVTCDPDVAWRLENDVRSAGLSTRVVNSYDTAAQSLSLQACEVCLVGPLAPGDSVEVSLSGLGKLTNAVQPEER